MTRLKASLSGIWGQTSDRLITVLVLALTVC
jgi:hypothetical protein